MFDSPISRDVHRLLIQNKNVVTQLSLQNHCPKQTAEKRLPSAPGRTAARIPVGLFTDSPSLP